MKPLAPRLGTSGAQLLARSAEAEQAEDQGAPFAQGEGVGAALLRVGAHRCFASLASRNGLLLAVVDAADGAFYGSDAERGGHFGRFSFYGETSDLRVWFLSHTEQPLPELERDDYGHDCAQAREGYVPSGMRATGKWLRFSAPGGPAELLRGWCLKYCIDIGEIDEEKRPLCHMCESERPIYRHIMGRVDPASEAIVATYFAGVKQPDVGCICAAWMTGYFGKGVTHQNIEKADYAARSGIWRKDCAHMEFEQEKAVEAKDDASKLVKKFIFQ